MTLAIDRTPHHVNVAALTVACSNRWWKHLTEQKNYVVFKTDKKSNFQTREVAGLSRCVDATFG